MLVPIIYLIAFGFGMGRSVKIGEGDYLTFLIPGLAAMLRGLFAYSLIVIVGLIASSGFTPGPIFFLTLILNSLLFANLGAVIGMRAQSHQDTSTYSNFLIMPMTFFSGTFLPIEKNTCLIQSSNSNFTNNLHEYLDKERNLRQKDLNSHQRPYRLLDSLFYL
jgi:ABC-2 type transport system permease protein